MKLFGKDEYIEVDLIESAIRESCSGKWLELRKERDDYQKRISTFFDIISRKEKNDNDICTAIKALKISRGNMR